MTVEISIKDEDRSADGRAELMISQRGLKIALNSIAESKAKVIWVGRVRRHAEPPKEKQA